MQIQLKMSWISSCFIGLAPKNGTKYSFRTRELFSNSTLSVDQAIGILFPTPKQTPPSSEFFELSRNKTETPGEKCWSARNWPLLISLCSLSLGWGFSPHYSLIGWIWQSSVLTSTRLGSFPVPAIINPLYWRLHQSYPVSPADGFHWPHLKLSPRNATSWKLIRVEWIDKVPL